MVDVEHRQRGPVGVGGCRRAGPEPLLFVKSRVRLQGQLQVQDVVYDMLEDFHFADFLILRDCGHQALQSAVAVVHVVLQAEQVLLLHPAPGDVQALLRQIVQRERAAAGGGGGVLGADWRNSLHLRSSTAHGDATGEKKPKILGYGDGSNKDAADRREKAKKVWILACQHIPRSCALPPSSAGTE